MTNDEADILGDTAKAVRAAAEELRTRHSAPLFGFALCTDDDVRTLFHVACVDPNVGFVYVDWTLSADDGSFELVSRKLAGLADKDANSKGWGLVRDQRFGVLVSALEECRKRSVFDANTFLCVGSTDPSGHLEALAMQGVEVLNPKPLADQFAKALGYERHR